jgi:hypothetical protein
MHHRRDGRWCDVEPLRELLGGERVVIEQGVEQPELPPPLGETAGERVVLGQLHPVPPERVHQPGQRRNQPSRHVISLAFAVGHIALHPSVL